MVRLQDDFYDYVNGEWAETAVIRMTTVNWWFYGLDPRHRNLMLDT